MLHLTQQGDDMSITDSETTELYKGCSIIVRVRRSDGGLFTFDETTAKPNAAYTGLPIEERFESSEEYPTEDAAREAGFRFAKKKIDGGW